MAAGGLTLDHVLDTLRMMDDMMRPRGWRCHVGLVKLHRSEYIEHGTVYLIAKQPMMDQHMVIMHPEANLPPEFKGLTQDEIAALLWQYGLEKRHHESQARMGGVLSGLRRDAS